MLKAIIIDDEHAGRETLELLLEKYVPEVVVLGTANSAETGKVLISEEAPDLVFLDIQMPGGSGFDMLSSLSNVKFQTVFVTAYSRYALQAFRFAALDYLQKPVKLEELQAAVRKAAEKKTADMEFKQLQYQVLQGNFQQPQSQDNRVALPTQDGFMFIPIKTIVRAKGSDIYTELFLEDGKKIVVTRKLLQLEEMLEGYRFCRIHKSHMINLNHLTRYIKGRGGAVEMSDGSLIEVARRKKAEFLKMIGS